MANDKNITLLVADGKGAAVSSTHDAGYAASVNTGGGGGNFKNGGAGTLESSLSDIHLQLVQSIKC